MVYRHEEIYQMLEEGKYDTVAQLISHRLYDPNVVTEEGVNVSVGDEPIIHIAFFNQRYDIVEWLIEHGADINALNIYRASILDFLIARYDEPSFPEIMKLLMELGADMNNFTLKRVTFSPHPYEELLEALLEMGMDTAKLQNSSFMLSAIHRNAFPAFFFALRHGLYRSNNERERSLLLEAALKAKDNNFLLYLCVPFHSGLLNIPLADVFDSRIRSMTPLQVVIEDLEKVKILLKAGADPNATVEGIRPLLTAFLALNYELAQLLIQYGASLTVEELATLLDSPDFRNSAANNPQLIALLSEMFMDDQESLASIEHLSWLSEEEIALLSEMFRDDQENLSVTEGLKNDDPDNDNDGSPLITKEEPSSQPLKKRKREDDDEEDNAPGGGNGGGASYFSEGVKCQKTDAKPEIASGDKVSKGDSENDGIEIFTYNYENPSISDVACSLALFLASVYWSSDAITSSSQAMETLGNYILDTSLSMTTISLL